MCIFPFLSFRGTLTCPQKALCECFGFEYSKNWTDHCRGHTAVGLERWFPGYVRNRWISAVELVCWWFDASIRALQPIITKWLFRHVDNFGDDEQVFSFRWISPQNEARVVLHAPSARNSAYQRFFTALGPFRGLTGKRVICKRRHTVTADYRTGYFRSHKLVSPRCNTVNDGAKAFC